VSTRRKRQVAVIGGSGIEEGGVMEAASRAASEAGGEVIGIVPGASGRKI
jgi:predicted Rossmann-fold nucleotide-binding protein